ncbi:MULTISPECIES: DUF1990 family protein [Streptomyces]|uniref:DUF1990 family protein n=1 Tax=Streptomyces TaxID=1883 RepID=UPI00093BDF0A|nr:MULTISPECIES: DUF1990 domain-containing protein [Streptomyces]MBX9421587.1 DUF1990 domain-containing protein [Streptomyces lateritius]OKJ66178.1 hypothetical protein AMK29_15935 [Streptomyces sp. CB02261]
MTRLLSSLSRRERPRPALTYPEVGATRSPAALPEGYHHLRHTAVVGHGRAAFEAAGAAVTTWRMHRASGARVLADTDRAEPGTAVEVSAGIGPLRIGVPCSVIWTAYDKDRTGFAYGTVTGHPECGEESFVVDLDPDGTVRFTVTAFSRPGVWYTRLAGPLVPLLQRAYAQRLGRTLRYLVRT